MYSYIAGRSVSTVKAEVDMLRTLRLAFVWLSSLLLFTLSLPASDKSLTKQEASPDVIQTLKQHFLFDEATEFLSKETTRGELRRRISSDKRFMFIAAEKQQQMVVDAYVTLSDPYIMGIQFYFFPKTEQLVNVMLPVNPLKGEVQARKLVRRALDSVSAPTQAPYVSPARLHFLGIYRIGRRSVIRIAVREDNMEKRSRDDLEKIYSVEYMLSGE